MRGKTEHTLRNFVRNKRTKNKKEKNTRCKRGRMILRNTDPQITDTTAESEESEADFRPGVLGVRKAARVLRMLIVCFAHAQHVTLTSAATLAWFLHSPPRKERATRISHILSRQNLLFVQRKVVCSSNTRQHKTHLIRLIFARAADY